jgi:hypothetical protein
MSNNIIFTLHIEQVNDDGNHILVELPFIVPEVYFSNGFFIVQRLYEQESITKDIEIQPGSAVWFRKDGVFYDYINNITGIDDSGIDKSTYKDYINVNKLYQYVGKIFHLNEYQYIIEYKHLEGFSKAALPVHQRTTGIKELFNIYFDKIHSKIYNRAKNTYSLIDPWEVDNVYLDYIANIYNMTLGSDITEYQRREITANLINFLKRKSTYASIYIIYKIIFSQSSTARQNRLNIYDRWLPRSITSGCPLEYFIDINYLKYYGPIQVGCAGSNYYESGTEVGYIVPDNVSFISRQDKPKKKWIVYHNLDITNPIVQVYDEALNLLIPESITVNNNICITIEFSEIKRGFVFITTPESSESHNNSDNWRFTHNLDSIPVTSLYNNNIIISDPSADGFDIRVYGEDDLYIENNNDIYPNAISATSGSYLYTQTSPSSAWTIEHDLDSRAVISDFFLGKEEQTWMVYHNLGTKDLIIQCYNESNILIIPDRVEFYNDSLIIIEFSTPQKGWCLISRADDVTSMSGGTYWYIGCSYNTIPLISEQTNGYVENTNDFVNEMAGDTIITISSTESISGNRLLTLSPDYCSKIVNKSDTWTVEHFLNNYGVISHFWVAEPRNPWIINHELDNENVIIQFYDDNSNVIYPEDISYQNQVITAWFNEKVSGYACLVNAAYVHEVETQETEFGVISTRYYLPVEYFGNKYFDRRYIGHTTPTYTYGHYFPYGYFSDYCYLDYFDIDGTLENETLTWVLSGSVGSLQNKNNVITEAMFYNDEFKEVLVPEDVVVADDGDTIVMFYYTPQYGHGLASKGQFVHSQTDSSSDWIVKHYLETDKMIIKTYSSSFIGDTWKLNHHLTDTIYQVYSEDKRYFHYNLFYLNTTRSGTTINWVEGNEGFVCVAPGDGSIPLSGSSCIVTHNLQRDDLICQFFNSSGTMVVPTSGSVHIVDNNNIQVTLSESDCHMRYVIADYVYTKDIETTYWYIEHNLNKAGMIVQCYDSSGNLVYPKEIKLRNKNILSVSFDQNTSGRALIKAVYPPVYEVLPDNISPYESNPDNWTKISFGNACTGLAIIKLAAEIFIPALFTYPDSVTILDENTIEATFDSNRIGYVSCHVSDTVSRNLTKTIPKNVQIIDENTIKATFYSSVNGCASLHSIGKLSYYDGLYESPHYKVEMDISCVPFGTTYIIREQDINQVVDYWSIVRPASKFAHYRVLVSPYGSWDLDDNVPMYTDSPSANIFTKCLIGTYLVDEYSYIFIQTTEASVWYIKHNLNTVDILVQCMDNEGMFIYPKNIYTTDVNRVTVIFDTPVAGRAMLTKAKLVYSLEEAESEASQFWTIDYDSIESTDVIHQSYFNDKVRIERDVILLGDKKIEIDYDLPALGKEVITNDDYIHTQSTLASSWTVNHNLGHRCVLVKVYSDDNKVLEPVNVFCEDKNTTIITLHSDYTGIAVIKAIGDWYTKEAIYDIASYLKIGNGTTDDYDPTTTGDLENTIGRSVLSLKKDTDDNYYYFTGDVETKTDSQVTEIGLYDIYDELIWYSKVIGDLFKPSNVGITVHYKISK